MNPRAVRIAGDCPKCKALITTRRRRSDGEKFVSCTRYPVCKWAGDYDAVLEEMDAEITRLQGELSRRPRQGGNVDVSRELRNLIAFAHPDRWPNAPDLAHEITVRLTALRERLS